jgi:hypothetical protein
MKRIYEFLGIDASFISTMVHDEINIARTPKRVWIERLMHHTAEGMRKTGLDKGVHLIRKSGIPDLVRKVNTKSHEQSVHTKIFDRVREQAFYKEDVEKLGSLLGRDMSKEWNI